MEADTSFVPPTFIPPFIMAARSLARLRQQEGNLKEGSFKSSKLLELHVPCRSKVCVLKIYVIKQHKRQELKAIYMLKMQHKRQEL